MKKGFTLSEVLVTLGIIGIVAALTVPSVMKNYKNRLYVAQLRKVYAQTAEAAQAIMADEHCTDFYETKAAAANSCSNANKGECEAGAGYFLNKYYKSIMKNCNKTEGNYCIATGSTGSPTDSNAYKSISGKNAGSLSGDYCIQTTNKAAICGSYNSQKKEFYLNIDVNGASAPNTTGRDVFIFGIMSNGLVVDYATGAEGSGFKPDPEKCSNPNSYGCLTKIIDAGWKMEY